MLEHWQNGSVSIPIFHYSTIPPLWCSLAGTLERSHAVGDVLAQAR
jgi:hypothetical protein